jgi:hypothetical protein
MPMVAPIVVVLPNIGIITATIAARTGLRVNKSTSICIRTLTSDDERGKFAELDAGRTDRARRREKPMAC